MRKKNKNIEENVESCLEGSQLNNNTIKNVKVLGMHSRNGRVYPIETMKKALHKYEGVVVNLDHKPNEPRSVVDRFGKITGVRLENDGIYGNLEYNPNHPYAPAFEYFVKNQPDAVGLSHAAIARTRMDNKIKQEVVEDIMELESVDLVAVAATNKSLFESYNKVLENQMENNSDEQITETVENPIDVKSVIEDFKSKNHVTHESYLVDMQEAVSKVLAAEMCHEDKAASLMEVFGVKFESPAKEVKDLDEAEVEESEDKTVLKVKAEESLRSKPNLGYKLILEELDRYRLKDEKEKKLERINEFCKSSGLEKDLVTEGFIEILSSVDENKWQLLVEDRKSIATSVKKPISHSSAVATGNQGLTVDELMKQLRS